LRRLALAGAALLLVATAACGSSGDDDAAPAPTTTTAASRAGAVELAVTDVATDLDTVWALKFDAAGKLWFTQRGGRLQQLGGPGRDIPGVVEQGEGGLMGLELDDRGRIYLMLTTANDNRVVRLADLQAQPEVLVDGIRKAAIHDGGRLRFGPDGTLYAGTGDSGDTSLPPKADSLNGKILAIDTAAKKATVFTKGHRNPQGLCFAADGRFLSTEHGPDKGDEINVITQGKDYGWPDSAGDGIKNWTPTIAPAGCVVYEADAIPQWKGSLLFVTLKEQDLRRLTFAADGSVAGEEVLYDGKYGRLRDVAVAPDGSVYLATSSKDSRGNPRDGDDRILRIAPKP
jgi:glucose/arabinose dehydrogenase